MNIGKFTVLMLAVCLTGAFHSQAQTADSTQHILQMRTFREGLVWIGGKEPSEAENEKLLAVLNRLDEPSWTTALEQFLKDYPQSPWAASLHYDYASFCHRTGRTTKALDQFEAAWVLAKADGSPQGQSLGGAILANWTDLLSSLGRVVELKELIAAGDQWHFVNARDRDMFQGAKNSYYLMQMHPEMAYRCGTFALKAVGEKMQPTNQTLENLVEVPSPTNGFNMAGLSDLAKRYGLNMLAVRRTAGGDLIVPSVVHWRQNHYAAILDNKDGLYLVDDPTFGHGKWMPAEVINEEASGEFLIPAVLATNGWSQTSAWQQLARDDAKTIHGMGLPNNINDGKDKGCKPGGPCPACPGMPVWWVTEPYINLWMADEPISYLTSRGEPVTFRITYKQRDSRQSPNAGEISNVGWDNSWASYIQLTSQYPCESGGGCDTDLGTCYAQVYLPGGGEVDYNPNQSFDEETRLLLLQRFYNGGLTTTVDNGESGLFLVHADGSQDVYGISFGGNGVYGDYYGADFLLSRHIAPNGDTTWFDYDFPTFSQALLCNVLDPDGRTNTLTYTANNLLSSVTNAYGQSAHFKYDSKSNLTNIVDAQGLSSSITYDTNGVPTSLITPYGTTQFSVFVNSTVANTNNGQGDFGGHNLIDRAIQVTDPIGANYLYLYRYDCSTNMSTTFSSSDVPTNTPLGTLDDGSTGTNFLTGVCYRNSFYWGPRQYPNLSTTNIFSFTANDYLYGRMQHWLEDTNQLDLTGYLSVERDASPDGSTPGLLTFYDYQGKLAGYNFCAGANPLPSVVAWRLPGGETHYEYKLYDYFGNVTNDITTWTLPNGSAGTRTNQYIYTDNTYSFEYGNWDGNNIYNVNNYGSYTIPNLLTQVIGADGNSNWAYGGFDTVAWTNLFYTDQTNAAILTSFRVAPDYATNGLGQVTQYTFTPAGNPVTDLDYWPGTTSFPNGSYGVPYGTTFPGYSKVTSMTTAAGLTTTNIYNTNGFLARTIDLQIGRTNSFGYTTDGLIGTYTNALGLNVAAAWDNLLRLTSVQFPDGTYVSNVYNNLDLSGVKDRLGNWTQYVYDGARHLISVTNANNAVTTLEWCGCGALTEVVDALNNTTTFNYDNQGNLTSVTNPDNSAINYQYNLAAWPTTLSDGAGRALQLAYNNQGLVTNITSANGALESVVFDILDRPVSITDANNVTVTNGYDAISELLTETWPDGIGNRFGYATSGLIAFTNRDNQWIHFGRDTAGRLIAVTNANSEVIQAAYDSASDITNLVDGLHHTTSWQYNQFGWLTNKIDGLGRNAFRFAYNANGWVTNRFTPEKGNTGYTYDNVGNLKTINYPLSTISYFYDAVNRLTNMVDAVETNAFTYTPAGQLASETGPWPNDTVAFTYFQGLRTNVSLTQPIGTWSQGYTYDSGWRMTNTLSPAGSFGYTFGALSAASALVNQVSLPNGATITNSYDTLARLTGTLLNNHWNHTLDGYTYTPDPLGLRTNIVRNLGLTTSRVSAGFDNIGQLISWNAAETNGMPRLNEELSFGYDAAHNLLRRTNNLLAQSFVVDSANELTNVTRNGTFTLAGATPAPATNITVNGSAAQTYGDFTFARTNLSLNSGQNIFTNVAVNGYGLTVTNTLTINLPQSVNFAFDNNGNLTNDGTRTFAYDSENQLTNVFVPSQWRSDFVYDGLNRRRIEHDYNWNGSTWVKTNEIHYIFDGYLLIQERDTNNNVLVTYTRGLDLSGDLWDAGGIDGLLARTDANGSTFYHADANGNITALMDGSENIVARYLYNPFGKLIGQWGTMAPVNEMQFSAMPHHNLSGLSLYPFRAYEPNFQRWLNHDPIGEEGGINLYRFVNNNPVNWIDSNGKIPIPVSVTVAQPPSYYYQMLPGNSSPSAGGESGGYFENVSLTIGSGGLGQSLAENALEGTSIGSNLKLYSDAFHGNQYVSVCEAGEWAKAAGPYAAGAGFAWDTYGLATGHEQLGKWSVNSGFGALGFWGGPYGAAGAGGYFLLDGFYPGGVPGALSNYSQTLNQVRQYDPTFNPQNP